MKKIALAAIAAIAIICGAGSQAIAEEAAASGSIKIGIVDLYKAVNESAQGKKAKADLESLVKNKQQSLESKGRAIEKLRGDLEKQGDVLSADAKKSKVEEYERLTREYQRNAADYQNDVRKKEAEFTARIIKELREIVFAIAKEDKYTLILERADGLVLFVDPSLDITDDVISRLDEGKKKKKK